MMDKPLIAAALWLCAWPAVAQDASAVAARSLAASCANCHGTQGAARSGLPVLAGVPAAQTLAAWAEFKSGARASTVMQQIAKGYSDEQIRAIAAFFAAQPVPR